MKRVILIVCLLAGSCSNYLFAQHWTSQEQEVINTVKKGWNLWVEAVDKKDLTIWVDGYKPMDDFVGWWTQNGALWGVNEIDTFEKIYLNSVKAIAVEDVDPISMRIYGDTALIYYYVIFQSQDDDGFWERFQQKRLEVFIQRGDRWRWAGCMVSADQADALR